MRQLLENILAAIGLLAVAYFASVGVLSLEKETAALMPMQHPMICDATISQGTYGQMSKPRCYVRGNK